MEGWRTEEKARKETRGQGEKRRKQETRELVLEGRKGSREEAECNRGEETRKKGVEYEGRLIGM